tara:strand:- start:801 stop:1211 length:411 start_codon:yes stop_codon:yes gene_type:complete
MIIGIGSDIVNIKRIEKIILKFGKKFENKIYSERENFYIKEKKNSIEAYASRWAAKEACLKALGLGIFFGISFKEIIIENEENGKPFLNLKGAALDRLKFIMPKNFSYKTHLTMSHDFPYAQATVLIEGLKKKNIK